MIEMRKGIFLLPLLLIGCSSEVPSNNVPSSSSGSIVVSAASSMTDALKQAADGYQKAHPDLKIQLNFGASQTLEQQIEKGAPADLFISASSKEMDELERKGLLLSGSREDLLSNTLVLVAKPQSSLKGWMGLSEPAIKRIAIANPKLAPAGDYAKQTLIHLKLWEPLQPKVVLGENVRQTLTYVTNGDADAGIVFGSDAEAQGDKVKIVAMAKEGVDHGPIRYPLAIVKSSPNVPVATAFAKYLESPDAQRIFNAAGFRLLSPGLNR